MAQQPAPRRLNWFRRGLEALGEGFLNMAGSQVVTLEDRALGQFLGGGPTLTGHVINDDSALRVTTAFACVRIIAETIGQVTLKLYERKANGNAEEVEHDLGAVLIDRPNADMGGMVYREALATNLAARGNAYSIIERNGRGDVIALLPIPTSRVQKKRKQDGSVVFVVNDRGRQETLPADKVWHWKGFGYDGFIGLSPIEQARQALGIAMAGEEAQARLFGQGLSTAAVVKFPQWLKPDQRKAAEEKLAQMHTGLMNYGRPYILEGGMDIAEGIFAPRDAQFLELRRMQIPELCRLWRISPHMIAELERATNNNIEQLSLEFATYTMMPYFRRIEEEARMLFKPEERARFFVRFNYESLLRADSQARAQLYSILLQNGVLNRNEVRGLENRNRVEGQGMDDYTVQSNMALLQLLESINKGNAQTTSQALKNYAELLDRRPAEASTHLNVHLPRDMKHAVAVDGVKEVVSSVRAGQTELAQAVSDLQRVVGELQRSAEESAKAAWADRVPVMDAEGNVERIRLVTRH